MSTRGIIAKKARKGYEYIYVHSDAYPSYTGAILTKYYKSPQKVDKLISLGDASFLTKSIGKKHDFDDYAARKKWTTFYGRDRGETGVGKKQISTIRALISRAITQYIEHIYVYKNGKWSHVYGRNG